MRSSWDIRSYLRVLGIVRRSKIHLLHGHSERSSLCAAIVGRLSGRPSIATVHSTNSRKHYLLNHKIIAANQAVHRHLLGMHLPDGRINVVHDGTPEPSLDVFDQRATRRQRLGLRPNDVAIVIVGELAPHKGHGLLISALAKLRTSHPHVHLYVVGAAEGDYATLLQKRVLECGLADNVHFLGYRTDVSGLLAAMDIFALPSHREGLSRTVLEAFSVGLPVVATIVRGVPEVVHHGRTGLLCSRGDASMLATMLTLLVEDRQWRATLGANARQRYLTRFTLRRMVTETEDVYRAAGA
jgi:glycosyltransferase involved in cell wall biosynthesis